VALRGSDKISGVLEGNLEASTKLQTGTWKMQYRILPHMEPKLRKPHPSHHSVNWANHKL
jgi:hypothetical protein